MTSPPHIQSAIIASCVLAISLVAASVERRSRLWIAMSLILTGVLLLPVSRILSEIYMEAIWLGYIPDVIWGSLWPDHVVMPTWMLLAHFTIFGLMYLVLFGLSVRGHLKFKAWARTLLLLTTGFTFLPSVVTALLVDQFSGARTREEPAPWVMNWVLTGSVILAFSWVPVVLLLELLKGMEFASKKAGTWIWLGLCFVLTTMTLCPVLRVAPPLYAWWTRNHVNAENVSPDGRVRAFVLCRQSWDSTIYYILLQPNDRLPVRARRVAGWSYVDRFHGPIREPIRIQWSEDSRYVSMSVKTLWAKERLVVGFDTKNDRNLSEEELRVLQEK